MRFSLSLILMLLSYAVSSATLYKVVAEDGSITYTDTPQPGAEPVDLSKVNSAVMPPLAKPTSQPNTSKQIKRAGPSFELQLISPSNEQSIRSNNGDVTITAKLSPKGAGMFQLEFDGEIVQTRPSPVFKLENVNRGAHTVVVHFIQNRGKILASTPSSTFYLKRASILNNPN